MKEMYRKKRRILAGVLAFVLLFSSGGTFAAAEEQEYNGGLCEHHPQHTDECGYVEGAEENPCTYVCDICAGDSEGKENSESTNGSVEGENTVDTTEGTSSETAGADTGEFAEDVTDSGEQSGTADSTDNSTDDSLTELVSWAWVDEAGNLSEIDDSWGLGVPGAAEDDPLTRDVLASMLPEQITAETAEGESVTADIIWDLSAIPEEGTWSGEYEVTAQVDGTYKLMDGSAPLAVKVQVGGAEAAASEANLQKHTVEGISPAGTTINLFDYWLSDDPEKRYDYDGTNPADYQKQGINKNNIVKFGTGMGQTDETDTLSKDNVNWWTLSEKVRPGIVQSVLDGGFPILSEVLEGGSLAYLFDPGITHEGKASYEDVEGLLQINDEGYYYYNSQENFAEFNEQSGAFTLYDRWGVYAGGGSPNGQFFPFNTGSQVFTDDETEGIKQADLNSKSNVESSEVQAGVNINHYFGLTMTTRFVQQDGGHTDSQKTSPVTYEFSGDDDVWVFIDDVLVADLGGIHDAATLKIDFSTGNVVINEGKGSGSTKTLKQLYEKAGMENTTSWSGKTYADNTYHTLKFFYLERGNTDSNMSLKFNFVTIPESSVIKVDQTGTPLGDVQFALYAADGAYNKVDYDSDPSNGETPIATGMTNSKGEFVFLDEEGMTLSLVDVYNTVQKLTGVTKPEDVHLVLTETSVPEGYRKSGDAHLYFYEGNGNIVLLSEGDLADTNNYWKTGTYASPRVTVTASPNGIKSADQKHSFSAEEVEKGTLFAVVLKYTGEGSADTEMLEPEKWNVVYGDPLDGWEQLKGASVANIIRAVQAGENYEYSYTFRLTSSGAYEATVANIPGDIKTYYYMLDEGQKDRTEYTIGYYFTTGPLSQANETNTYRLDSSDFDRVFSTDIYVSNIKNRLLVQKTDDTGDPVSGAEFGLYKEDQVTVDDATGTVTIKKESDGTEVQPFDSVTTEDLTGAIELPGGGIFPTGEKVLAEGIYYLKEIKAPEGYIINPEIIKVIVDETGVYADAGDEEDGVAVLRGVGSIVKSMVQFATDDDIDTTLHDIKATLLTSDTYPAQTDWNESEQVMHLQFENKHAGLEYGPYDLSEDAEFNIGNVTLRTESGWSKLKIQQCLEEDHQTDESIRSHKTDLGDTDLTTLFSGTVTVQVTDARTKLTITKKAEAENGQSVPENEEFGFTLELTDAQGNTLTGTYPAEKKMSDGSVETLENPIGNNSSFSLKDGESLVIYNLPLGTKYNVTEDSTGGRYETSVQVDAGEKTSGSAAEGTITENPSEVLFFNRYRPGSITITKRDGSGNLLLGAGFTLYEYSDGNADGIGAQIGEEKEVKLRIRERFKAGEAGIQYDSGLGRVTVEGKTYIVHRGKDEDGTEYLYYYREPESGEDENTPGAEAIVEFTGLDVGKTYVIKETKVPDGYVDSKLILNGEDGKGIRLPVSGVYDISYTVENHRKLELPVSGMKGVSNIAAVGMLIFTAGAGVFLASRKRRPAGQEKSGKQCRNKG